MNINVGSFDRVVRVVVGVFLLALVVLGPKTLWGLIGIVPLITGVFGVCPVYKVFGISTCSTGGGPHHPAGSHP